MLAISLMRMGAKKSPFYRVVVKEKRGKRDGQLPRKSRYIQSYGEPRGGKPTLERIQYWIGVGANRGDRRELDQHTQPSAEAAARQA